MPERREINLPSAEEREQMLREVIDRQMPEQADHNTAPEVHPKSQIKESISPFEPPKSEKPAPRDFEAPHLSEKEAVQEINKLISGGSDPGAMVEFLAKNIKDSENLTDPEQPSEIA
jgi:hypothetical protein